MLFYCQCRWNNGWKGNWIGIMNESLTYHYFPFRCSMNSKPFRTSLSTASQIARSSLPTMNLWGFDCCQFFCSTWKVQSKLPSEWNRNEGKFRAVKGFIEVSSDTRRVALVTVRTKGKSWCHVVNTSFKWMLWISEDDDVQQDDNRPEHTSDRVG